ncbi:MAG TPA: AI-2E family transporter [Candidatus Dormibacteraeota bacterium]|nr:AI-2E family transporter [Candidatus Dormibacteraeota bacterium]
MRTAEQEDARAADDGVSAPVAVIAAATEHAVELPLPRRLGVAAVGLFVLAILYTLFVARVLILPIVLAVLLSLILWPIVRALRRFRIPEALGALLVLIGLASVFAYGAYALSGPAATWFAAAPQALRRIETRLRAVKETVADVQQATNRVEQIATVGGDASRVVAVQQGGSLSTLLLASTSELLAGVGVVLVLTYFLLASGDLFLRKCLSALRTKRDRQLLLEMARELQNNISGYLLTVSLINAGLGVAVAVVMALYGVPNPLLWGALAFGLNFIPYIGATVGIACVAAASLITFDTLGQALAPPATYLALTTLEAYLVTPAVLSRRFTLNPVVVLIALLFWGWIWGIPGALIAMPILVTVKIVCDYVPSLATFGEFLSN